MSIHWTKMKQNGQQKKPKLRHWITVYNYHIHVSGRYATLHMNVSDKFNGDTGIFVIILYYNE